jgi:hypothetical protein
MKRCTRCGEQKPLAAFRHDRSRKDGGYSQCRACEKEWRTAKAEHLKAYHHAWNRANPDKKRAHDFEDSAESVVDACWNSRPRGRPFSSSSTTCAPLSRWGTSNRCSRYGHRSSLSTGSQRRSAAWARPTRQRRRSQVAGAAAASVPAGRCLRPPNRPRGEGQRDPWALGCRR